MRFDAIIFDFDGVIIDSEYASNAHLAAYLTDNGCPTTTEESMRNFMGLSGERYRKALEGWLSAPLPDDFDAVMQAAHERFLADGLPEVAGATTFVRALPAALPCAVASSSSTSWISGHLQNLGIGERFGEALFSGREHVANGKPAPDLYLHAARALGVAIDRCLIIEDSPIGIAGAVASGAHVIGLLAGRHCQSGHGDTLEAAGAHDIARSYDEVARIAA